MSRRSFDDGESQNSEKGKRITDDVAITQYPFRFISNQDNQDTSLPESFDFQATIPRIKLNYI